MTLPDVTHLMFIDNDITWNPIEVIKLLISGKDLVGGAYPLKTYAWEKLLSQRDKTVNDIINEKRRKSDIFNLCSDDLIFKSQLLRYNMNILSNNLSIVKNVTEIRHLPTGFMLMKREVIEKMIEAFPDTKYNDDIGFLSKEEDKFAYALFDTGIADKHYLSEDWLFCERWRGIGGLVHLDVSLVLSHTGNEDFTGCYLMSI
jgi:hypothetical protein